MRETSIQTTEEFLPLFDEDNPHYLDRYLSWYGGRGGMKSWSVGRGLAVRGARSPKRILCGREFQTSITDSVYQLLVDQISALNLGGYYRILKNGIEGYNGSKFIFKGLKRNINNVKSFEVIDIFWNEEAQTTSEESWTTLIPTIRKEGSQIISTFNPMLETDPTYQRLVAFPKEDSYLCKVNYDSNPFFPETLRKEMEYDRKHNYESYLHVWEGMPVKHSEALVFKNWKVDGTIKPKTDTPLYYGADWGFANDPSTLLRCWADLEKRELYVDYEAYGVGVEIDDTPELFRSVPGSNKWKITADSARPETISYMNRNGFKVVGAKKGAGSVEDGIEFLKSMTIIVHPRCKRLISELGLYKYKVDKLTDEVLPILVDANNHCIDAIRYAFEAIAFKRMRINIG